jgi:Kef-type K+ transport system membrane component KefB
MIAFLVPVFFVLVGFRTNLRAMASPILLTMPFVLTIAAIVGKLASGAGVLGQRARRRTVAIGMIPRGEVTLVFAALGATLQAGQRPLLDEQGYTALVGVVILTTLVTPAALKWSARAGTGPRSVTKPAA